MLPFFDKIITTLGRKRPPSFIDPREFTEEFSTLLRERLPTLDVMIYSDLHLNISVNNQISSLYLDKLYERYVATPERKIVLVEDYLQILKQKYSVLAHKIHPERIIPLFKTKNWAVSQASEAQEKGAVINDTFTKELVIVYGEKPSSPEGQIEYLTNHDLSLLDLTRSDLRPLAVQNLVNLLGKIEVHQGPGAHMLVADGSYESSLWLVDKLMDLHNLPPIKGELVVAIPSVETLIVTGSEEKIGLQKTQEIIDKISTETYEALLSDKLFVRRDSTWQEYA